MVEYRTVSFMQPLEKVLGTVSEGVRVGTIDFTNSVPELAEHMG